MSAADEFETIAQLFAPLADGAPGALSLRDDVALLRVGDDEDLVVTADAIVEGVHFLSDDPLDLVARKLLRVNLSDLAAKSSTPFAYLLTVAWSPRCGWAERRAFAAGLATDQAAYGVSLVGGDTVSTPGPLTASVTAFGRIAEGKAVLRSGARAGDRLFVSGTIGDGVLGLRAAQGRLPMSEADIAALAGRYRLPQPRLALREPLRRFATAAADVSDGLVADAGNIARASGLRAEVALDRVPLSPAAESWLVGRRPVEALTLLATGGDDYEIVCTASADAAEPFIAAARLAGLRLTEVGRMVEGDGVSVTCDGAPVKIDRPGWRHG